MICTTKTNPKVYQGHYSPSDRRLRVLANAFYGLPIYSGLESTGTERRATEATIRFLKQKALLDQQYKITDQGERMLSLVWLKGHRRNTNVQNKGEGHAKQS